MVFVVLGCESKSEPPAAPVDEPAAAIEDEEPLLLLEDGDGDSEDTAINYRCHVCHYNFASEDLSITHARQNIGCEHCHGPCDAHCDDEDNITPPDIMYPAEKIEPLCLGCHGEDTTKIPAHSDIKDDDGKKLICTQCHGEHRMNHRTRRWDPYTGELIEDDNVRMLE